MRILSSHQRKKKIKKTQRRKQSSSSRSLLAIMCSIIIIRHAVNAKSGLILQSRANLEDKTLKKINRRKNQEDSRRVKSPYLLVGSCKYLYLCKLISLYQLK